LVSAIFMLLLMTLFALSTAWFTEGGRKVETLWVD